MNKKGFTLVELLAVIVILALVMTVASSSVISIRNNSFKRMVDIKLNDLEGSAIVYGQTLSDELNETCEVNGVSYNFCKVVTVKELIEKDFYKTEEVDDDGKRILINNLTRNSMLCDTIQIYRKNNRIYAVTKEVLSNKDGNVCDLVLD